MRIANADSLNCTHMMPVQLFSLENRGYSLSQHNARARSIDIR